MRLVATIALALSSLIGACGTPASSTPVASPSPVAGVEVHPWSDRGDWAVVSRTMEEGGAFGTTELWAADLSGKGPKLVLAYPRSWIGETFVSRQLSADGGRFGFSTDVAAGRHRIVVADIRSGRAHVVDQDPSDLHDGHPTWSPDGSRLAFSRMTRAADGHVVQAGLWVINADGGGLRKLAEGANAPTYVYDWTPDGRFIGIAQNVGYTLVDATTGAIRSTTSVITPASWRGREPAFVAAISGQGSEVTIATGAGPHALGPAQIRVTAPTIVSRPRWNPVRDEFLYLRSAPSDIPAATIQIRGGGLDVGVPLAGPPGVSEWSPDGESIVYLRTDVLPDPSRAGAGAMLQNSMRAVRRDGSAEHEIFSSVDDQGRPLSLAGDFATRHY
jgi:hypothetical protein